MLRSTIYATLLLLLFTQSTQAASLVVNSNTVIGASGVNVNGILYDVAIGDGTCVSLFNGCDQSADFPFASSDDTINALQALLSILQTPFNNNPNLSFAGCNDQVSSFCLILTPRTLVNDNLISHFLQAHASTRTITLPTNFNLTPLPNASDTTIDDSQTFARWTPQQTNNVPEPNAFMLLGIGLLSQRWLRIRGKRVLV